MSNLGLLLDISNILHITKKPTSPEKQMLVLCGRLIAYAGTTHAVKKPIPMCIECLEVYNQDNKYILNSMYTVHLTKCALLDNYQFNAPY